MRVLHVTARSDLGGGPKSLLHLIEQSDGGARHYVACPRDVPYWSRYESVLGVNALVAIPHRKFRLSALFGIVGFIRSERIQLIHSHGFGGGVYGRIAGLITGIPTVHTFHGLHYNWRSPLRAAVQYAVEFCMSFWSAAFVAVSPSEQRCAMRYLWACPRRVELIPNGINGESDVVAGRNGSGGKNETQIIWMGRLERDKRPFEAVAVIKELCALRPQGDFALDVVGGGPLLATLQSKVKAAGLEGQIRLRGAVEQGWKLIQGAEILLATSRGEGLPGAVLEAMLYGTVNVATAVRGHCDVIENGITGFLYPVGCPKSAAKILNDIMSGTVDVMGIRQRAGEFVRNGFSWPDCRAAYEALYRDILAETRHG